MDQAQQANGASRARAGRVAAALLASLVLSALGWAALATPVAAERTESDARALDRAGERLEGLADRLDEAEPGSDEHAEAVAEAEVAATELAEAAERAEQAVVRQAERVRHAEQERDAAAEEAAERADALAARAQSLYRLRVEGSGSLGALLEAGSPDEALRRSSLLEAMSRTEVAAIERLAADQRALADREEALMAEEAALAELTERRAALAEQAREVRDAGADDLPGFAEELEALQAQETHLDSEQRELADLAAQAAGTAAEEVAAAAEDEEEEDEDAAPAEAQWRWPAQGPVTSEYGMRWGRLHEGIDIGGATGQAVVAARSGVVASTGRQGGYGNLVIVDHGGGVTTAYAHLNSIEVSPGQSVEAGERLGGMGCTGRCTGTHLHFEVRIGGQAQNPRGYLP